MKPTPDIWKRPATAADVARASTGAESFGRAVRDWQHELRRCSSRKAFAEAIREQPPLMAGRFDDHRQCDAWLAAYVDWLCRRHAVEVPPWIEEPERFAERAWYDYPPVWMDSFVNAPAAFRRRGVFTRAEDPLHFRRGRPRVSSSHHRQRNAERQRRYRARVRAKLERLKELEGE